MFCRKFFTFCSAFGGTLSSFVLANTLHGAFVFVRSVAGKPKRQSFFNARKAHDIQSFSVIVATLGPIKLSQ